MRFRACVAIWAVGFGAMIAAGCGDDPSCAQGSEACACFPNHTCLGALQCASGFCVDLDSKDSGADAAANDQQSGHGGRTGSNGRAGSGAHAGSGASDEPDASASDHAGEGGSGQAQAGEGGTHGTIEQGDECEHSEECAALDDPCLMPVCASGVCESASRSEGSLIDDQLAGNCQQLVCDADGVASAEIDPNDLPEDDEDPCTVSACDGSDPVQMPAIDGTDTPASYQTDGDCLRLVCDGEGGLRSATDDGDVSADPPGETCKQRACDQGSPVLVNATPGTSCGAGMVCDSQAGCNACIPDAGSCTTSAQCCGGFCQNGTTCATCTAGTGDCDGSSSTGCETALNSATDCGSCHHDCSGRPFVLTPNCLSGACSVLTCESGHADLDHTFENGCEELATVGPNGAYANCTMATADQCGAGERCGTLSSFLVIMQFSPCTADPTHCICSFPCSAAEACPVPASGTAVPACASGYCYLPCTSGTTTCPTGMTCRQLGTPPFLVEQCAW